MRIAILVQYDGTDFSGWQIQPDNATIQGAIEAALKTLYGESVGIMGSGRTDSGVHAFGQVAHFDLEASNIPPENLWMALNRHLPRSIRLLDSQVVADDFHSRFQANERTYRYEIDRDFNILHRNSRWYVRFPLDLEKLNELAILIAGSHDFSSFCYAGTETENMICNVAAAAWDELDESGLVFRITADRYLHHMVRMLVGSMIEVARGKWDIDYFHELLRNPDRQNHATTAPASGLALVKVGYPADVEPDWSIGTERFAIEASGD